MDKPDPISVTDGTILTSTGRHFNLLDPKEADVYIGDIAHALSHICRFCGHTRIFYSVAQHSVIVSEIIEESLGGDVHAQMAGLVHDTPEAYVGDVAKPLKVQISDYQEIEERVERVVMSYFGVGWPLPGVVKEADLIALATERRDLMPMPPNGPEWALLKGVTPMREKIVPLPPERAKDLFADRYLRLAITEG